MNNFEFYTTVAAVQFQTAKTRFERKEITRPQYLEELLAVERQLHEVLEAVIVEEVKWA